MRLAKLTVSLALAALVGLSVPALADDNAKAGDSAIKPCPTTQTTGDAGATNKPPASAKSDDGTCPADQASGNAANDGASSNAQGGTGSSTSTTK